MKGIIEYMRQYIYIICTHVYLFIFQDVSNNIIITIIIQLTEISH